MWHKKPRTDSLPNGFITGIDQVCTVVSDLDATLTQLTERLGIGPFKVWDVKPPALFQRTFRGQEADWTMKLGVALVGRTQWEVIQPVGGPSLYHEHLARAGQGVHHLLVETAHTSHERSVEKLEAAGFAHAQTAMLNIPLQIGALTIPAAPRVLAESLSTHFGYADTVDALKTTLELARFPPGVSRPLGIRIGKPDSWVPNGAKSVAAPLPNGFLDNVVLFGFLTRDLDATVKSWADRAGVGPWHIVDVGPRDLGEVRFAQPAHGFRARIAWALIGSMVFEIIEPLEGDSPHARALATRGEGLHYVGVSSSTLDFSDAVQHFEQQGCPVIMQGVLHGGLEFALVDATEIAHTWLQLMCVDGPTLFGELRKLPGRTYPASDG